MNQRATILSNIREVIALEQRGRQRRSVSDKIADVIATFSGRVIFVVLHLVWFALWAAFNSGLFGNAQRFDPYPFALLCMLVSLEGVLLSTFVLIKQNRMAESANRREHLGLQVNLLTEKEVTKALQLLVQLSERMQLEVDLEARELSENTAVGELARELEAKLPQEM